MLPFACVTKPQLPGLSDGVIVRIKLEHSSEMKPPTHENFTHPYTCKYEDRYHLQFYIHYAYEGFGLEVNRDCSWNPASTPLWNFEPFAHFSKLVPLL